MVLMHGMGGGCAYFFPIIKQLAQYFDLILIDIIGFAGSSRPDDYDPDTISPKDSIEYFVNFFEKWRKQMKYILYRLNNN